MWDWAGQGQVRLASEGGVLGRRPCLVWPLLLPWPWDQLLPPETGSPAARLVPRAGCSPLIRLFVPGFALPGNLPFPGCFTLYYTTILPF